MRWVHGTVNMKRSPCPLCHRRSRKRVLHHVLHRFRVSTCCWLNVLFGLPFELIVPRLLDPIQANGSVFKIPFLIYSGKNLPASSREYPKVIWVKSVRYRKRRILQLLQSGLRLTAARGIRSWFLPCNLLLCPFLQIPRQQCNG